MVDFLHVSASVSDCPYDYLHRKDKKGKSSAFDFKSRAFYWQLIWAKDGTHIIQQKNDELKKINIFGWFHDLYSLFASKENLWIIRLFFFFFPNHGVWYVEF